MKFILGTKQSMQQVFDEAGRRTPVTVVLAGPLTVTQIKTPERDRYQAVQFGSGERRVKNLDRAPRYLRELRLPSGTTEEFKVGQTFDVSIFSPGDRVLVSGVSKGKGFQGVVRRHGFHGGSRTHGQKHSEREPGSIGGGLRTRVPKNMRMAGRMGGGRITVRGLRVVGVDSERRQLLISGAVPGRRGTLLEIRGNEKVKA